MFKWLKYLDLYYIMDHENRMRAKLTAADLENRTVSRSEYCQISIAKPVEIFWAISVIVLYNILIFSVVLAYMILLFWSPIPTVLVSAVGVIAFVWYRCNKKYREYLKEKT
jgi:Flp pilus assembly protein TadB